MPTIERPNNGAMKMICWHGGARHAPSMSPNAGNPALPARLCWQRTSQEERVGVRAIKVVGDVQSELKSVERQAEAGE